MSASGQASVEPKARSESKQALVLSGGHVRGAWQAGAVAKILEEGKFRPCAIYGISVGSINGGMLASYVGKQFLEDPTRKEADFADAGAKVESFWRDEITGHEKIGRKRSPVSIALDVLRHNFHGILDVDKSIEIIKAQIRAENLRTAAANGLKFYAGTLNLTANSYLDATLDENADAESQQAIVDYVIASCMAPLVMPMWVIPSQIGKPFARRWWENYRERRARKKRDHEDRDDCWLDGGIYNPVPISSAIEAGYDDIICVVTRPKKLRRGSFQGRLGPTGERIEDVVTQRLLEEDIQWAFDMKAWNDALEGCIRTLTPKQLEKYMANPKFKNYRSFQIKVVRPDEPLLYTIETLTKGEVAEMADNGRAAAQAVMSRYERHIPATFPEDAAPCAPSAGGA